MDLSRIRSLPRQFINKQGTESRMCLLAEEARQRLVAMYLAYQPRNSFQGLPPLRDEVCARWVQDMIRDGINIVVFDPHGQIDGHTGLFPINDRKCELLVVVTPGRQNMGLGTELVRACIAAAAELGFERICLPVAASNLRARHVYRKCGFEYCSQSKMSRELDMELVLPSVAPIAAPHFALGAALDARVHG